MTISTSIWVKSVQKSIDEEIEKALQLYSDELCEKILAIPGFRQKLSAYVLDKIETENPDLKNRQHRLSKTKFPYRSLELRLLIERYVTEGIAQILDLHLEMLDCYIPKDDYLFCPSCSYVG
ncbi:hypothetical protein NIES593_22330 [Hydrococcus rivularis NIES-593]|uniref:Uncharacterized protein n=1 Tax=Hydrococcus rivularis NIES-593 TaxID=1921803 RepID=A0A1U7H7J7_9CYAN|nr:hypothetical protein [Hydrococcus rivularis]OKH18260.1 hypothetical protein NIES593_22330 [Hydrococcus rivularis NIES-593]